MNIIFGTEQANNLQERFTVLELDTFIFGNTGTEMTAYCLIETMPLDKLPLVESWKCLHEALIKNYQQRNWAHCNVLIEQLMGSWNLEMDSFYDDLKQRIDQLLINPPDDKWSPVIERPIGALF